MYIGQQKNYWICDLKNKLYDKQLIDPARMEGLFEDAYWVDQVSSLESDYKISLNMLNDSLGLSYCNKKYNLNPADLGFKMVEQLVPNYILEANISLSKK